MDEVTTQVICDKCGDRGESYLIELPDGRRWSVDLCSADAEPLTRLVSTKIGHEAPRHRRAVYRKSDLTVVAKRVTKRT